MHGLLQEEKSPSNEVFELIASKIFHVKDCDGMPRFHPHEQVFRGPARTPGITVVTRSLIRLITSARAMREGIRTC